MQFRNESVVQDLITLLEVLQIVPVLRIKEIHEVEQFTHIVIERGLSFVRSAQTQTELYPGHKNFMISFEFSKTTE